jgi:hypothetical protein
MSTEMLYVENRFERFFLGKSILLIAPLLLTIGYVQWSIWALAMLGFCLFSFGYLGQGLDKNRNKSSRTLRSTTEYYKDESATEKTISFDEKRRFSQSVLLFSATWVVVISYCMFEFGYSAISIVVLSVFGFIVTFSVVVGISFGSIGRREI